MWLCMCIIMFARISPTCYWSLQTLAARRLMELQEALQNHLDVIKKFQHMQVGFATILSQVLVRFGDYVELIRVIVAWLYTSLIFIDFVRS